MHIIAAKAVAFELALQPEFRTYCQQIVSNAKALAAAWWRMASSSYLEVPITT